VLAKARQRAIADDRAAKIVTEAEAIQHDLDVLNKGNDVHNMHFARKLIEEITDRLKGLCKELKLEEPNISLPPPLKDAPTSPTQASAK
jgi:hypothetical protein